MRSWQKVAVLCPGATVSGGPEALHQLAGALRARGADASLVYYPQRPEGYAVPVPYRHYRVALGQELPDDPSTLLVIPEVITSMAWRFPRAQKSIWWLSVDNYFKWQHRNSGPSILEPRPDILHLCQSVYALRFLAAHGAGPAVMLTDYITEGAFGQGQPAIRTPGIAYNPKKGLDTTRRLMERDGGRHCWIPLHGLEKPEMAALLRSVRVYVDFGEHPGRDRMPREAALCGAVVVTGRRGAAALQEDLPLADRFRLDETDPDFEARAMALLEGLLRSDVECQAAMAEQESYRRWIAGNKDAFLAEVDALLTIGRGMPEAA